MKFILGTKEKMTQVFDDQGNVIPATIVNATPMIAVQIKTKEKDGYQSVQFGFGQKKIKNTKRPQKGHLKKAGFSTEERFSPRFFREFRIENTEIKPRDKIDVSVFKEGDVVVVSGISKGKGFQGVVKRHGFSGGPRTHGQKHSEREPGSIGSTGPQRVLKGTRMAGRMGGKRVTVNNLKIVKVDNSNNQLYISGAIPGRRGTLLEIRSI